MAADPDPTTHHVASLLDLARRLESDGRAAAAVAARCAAARCAAARCAEAASDGLGRGPRALDAARGTAFLRARALDVAARLDGAGLCGEAGALYEEVVRRAAGALGALTDKAFGFWVDALEAGHTPPGGPDARAHPATPTDER